MICIRLIMDRLIYIAATVQPDNVEFIWNLRGIRIHIQIENPDN